jgi:hypothetical protein
MFSFPAVSFVEWEIDGLRNNGRRNQHQYDKKCTLYKKMFLKPLH